jgi:site-specific DNA recombinase
MKVALYARVSTKSQEKLGTIASQIEALRSHAHQQAYAIVPEYACCDDGYSGATLARPGLDRLRDGARSGAFDAILVLCPDRLSRKYAYLILILEEFERFGVEVLFVEHGVTDDPQGALLLQIQGAVAEYERAKHAERYRRGKLHRARQGEVFWTSIPYGYRRIPRRDSVPAHLEINEAEANLVRRIFAWHADENLSVRQIAKRLTREGYVPPKGGKRWGETTVHRILRREAYLGTLYYNRSQDATVPEPDRIGLRTRRVARPKSEWIGVSIPAIIDTETFERSESRHFPNQQFSPRNLREERWLLRRLLRCGRCGYKCACVADKRRPHMPPSHYYRCDKQDRMLGGERCHPNHFRSQPLDDLVWAEMRRVLLDPAVLVRAGRALADTESFDESFLATQLRNVRRRWTQARGERSRLLDGYQGGFLEKEEFEGRAEKVSKRIESLEKELNTLRNEYETASDGKRLLASLERFTAAVTRRLDTMTFHQKQDLVRKVLEEVVISGHIVKLYFKIPLPRPEEDPPDPPDRAPSRRVSTKLILRSRPDQGVQVRVKVQFIPISLDRHDRSRGRIVCERRPHIPSQCLPGAAGELFPTGGGRDGKPAAALLESSTRTGGDPPAPESPA